TAMISALSLALLFPRVGRLMCFSATGVTIAFLAALTLMASRRPDWLDSIPPRPDAQAGALALLTLIGMVLQWQFLPSRRELLGEPHRAEESTLSKRPAMSSPSPSRLPPNLA